MIKKNKITPTDAPHTSAKPLKPSTEEPAPNINLTYILNFHIDFIYILRYNNHNEQIQTKRCSFYEMGFTK